MAVCQAIGCSNKIGRVPGKSFFKIPDAAKHNDLAKQWLCNIGVECSVSNFKFSKNKVVCEDHFEPDCFQRDLRNELLNCPQKRKLLKEGAIPTLTLTKRLQQTERFTWLQLDTVEVKPEGGNDHINLKVSGQDGTVVQFKIKRHTPLKKLMNAYCVRQGLKVEALRFRFDGNPISEDDTPQKLDMENEDVIDVFQQQIGGYLS
ncbi:uncharacterized protein LOC144438722 isoform X1 [Glandiceps talaboti]